MKTATSTEQRTDNSWAFLNKPPFRFKNVLKARKARKVSVESQRETWVGKREEALHRTISVILDGFDLNLSSPHGDGLWVSWIDGLLAVASPRGATGTERRRRRQGRGGMEVDSV